MINSSNLQICVYNDAATMFGIEQHIVYHVSGMSDILSAVLLGVNLVGATALMETKAK